VQELTLRLEQDGRLIGEWQVGTEPLDILLEDPGTGRTLATLRLGRPESSIDAAEHATVVEDPPPGHEASCPLPETCARKADDAQANDAQASAPEADDAEAKNAVGTTPQLPGPAIDGPTLKTPPAVEPAAEPENVAPLPSGQPLEAGFLSVETRDTDERDQERRTDRVPEFVPFGNFEDLDTQVVQSPFLATPNILRRDEPPTVVSPAEKERGRGQYDELPFAESQAGISDDDLSLPMYGLTADNLPRGADDDFTLPLPEDTAKILALAEAEAMRRQSHGASARAQTGSEARSPGASHEQRGRPNPAAGNGAAIRPLFLRGAEVWFRQGGEWMPRGTMTVRQHVQAFGGMVRCDDNGGLVVLPGARLAGSAALPSGETVHIEPGGASVKLPAGTSVILWNGEQGLYVRSNVLPETQLAEDAPVGPRKASYTATVPRNRPK
jgi:hypothetical protein